MEYEQSDGATGALYRKGRVSQSALDAGLNWTGAFGQWMNTLASVFDQTLASVGPARLVSRS